MIISRLFIIVSRLSNSTKPLLRARAVIHQSNKLLNVQGTKYDKPPKTLKKEKAKVEMYIVKRYLEYVKQYRELLEKRFPTAMNMYRVFSVGLKEFLKDLKTYIGLRVRLIKEKGFSNMQRKEIELYQKMPQDMVRIAPVLLLSAIPFGNYIMFPLAFLKPKSLLCSHFWSIQQRAEFSIQDLTDRLRNNKPVFRALQAKLNFIEDENLKEKWDRVVGLLGSGVHPTAKEVLECKPLFTKEPYQLDSLTYAHMGHLLNMHGLRKGILRKKKLKYRAFLLMELDKAIIREGGLEALSTDSLRYSCLIRGLNSTHLSNQDMREWLQQWLTVSEQTDKTAYSLILHCPIFFAYNHPQNWMLIY